MAIYNLLVDDFTFSKGFNTICLLGWKHYSTIGKMVVDNPDEQIYLQLVDKLTGRFHIAKLFSCDLKKFIHMSDTEIASNHASNNFAELTLSMSKTHGDLFTVNNMVTILGFSIEPHKN